MALKVEFKKSGKTVDWEGRFENLLDLAESHGIEIETECLQGFCGTCKTELLSGEVHMEVTDGLDNGEMERMILPCVSIPVTDITIKA